MLFRSGDTETRRHGDTPSPRLPFSASPCPLMLGCVSLHPTYFSGRAQKPGFAEITRFLTSPLHERSPSQLSTIKFKIKSYSKLSKRRDMASAKTASISRICSTIDAITAVSKLKIAISKLAICSADNFSRT